MKIMSFNTQHCKNYLEQKIDYEIMARAICSQGADIVGLNEIYNGAERVDFVDQVQRLSELTGLTYHYFAEATMLRGINSYGNGFLSRVPIVSAETIAIPDPTERKYNGYYETRCLLKVKLENGYTVLVTHFGLNPDEQQNAVDTIVAHLASEKCILMGDFNVRPDNDILAPIRARMRDAADKLQGNGYTFPSDAPSRKIDYIFLSPDIELSEAEIPEVIASDHRPHTATID